jgi:thiol:disulfide interchange protein DsbD
MMRWLIIFLLNSFIVSGQINEEVVKVNVPKLIVQAGKQFVISVSVEVKNGYHIQAHEARDQFIKPTTLEVDGGKEFIIEKQVFPSAKKFRLEGTDEYLDVYDGKFEIQTFFIARKKIQKSIHHLNGKLNYQACDSVRCLFPRTVEFSIDVDVR